jgi:hypothetical protein
MSEVKCSICGNTYDRIPPDAVQIGRGGVSPLYRFPNGEVHALGSTKLGKRKAAKPQEKQKDDNAV